MIFTNSQTETECLRKMLFSIFSLFRGFAPSATPHQLNHTEFSEPGIRRERPLEYWVQPSRNSRGDMLLDNAVARPGMLRTGSNVPTTSMFTSYASRMRPKIGPAPSGHTTDRPQNITANRDLGRWQKTVLGSGITAAKCRKAVALSHFDWLFASVSIQLLEFRTHFPAPYDQEANFHDASNHYRIIPTPISLSHRFLGRGGAAIQWVESPKTELSVKTIVSGEMTFRT
jgi:hypothetical protein